MSNNNFILKKGQHVACVNEEGQLLIGEDGKLAIQDVEDNCLYAIDVNDEVCKFFGLSLFQESGPCTDMAPVECAQEACTDIAPVGVVSTASTSQAYSKSSPSTSQVAQWYAQQEKSLIRIWKAHQSEFGDSKLKSIDVWKRIQDDLKREGFNYDVKQVENKWKNLRKSFMAYVDSCGPNNSGGEPLKKPKHFDELDIFRKTPHVQPTIASSKRKFSLTVENLSDEEKTEEPSIPTPRSQRDKKSGGIKGQTKVQKELSWAESMREESQRKEEVRTERYNSLLAVYSQMADAQQRSAASLEQFTQFLMKK